MAQKAHDKKARRPRGSFPPALSLADATSIITHLYENVGGDATYDTFAGVISNSPSSSTFVRKLGTLKNYGLVTDENRHIRLSDVGEAIVAPISPRQRAEALKRAFLNIEVFATLFDKYKGKLLPQDEFLTNVVSGLVPKEFVDTWIDRFMQSAKAAGLIRDRGDGKLQVREMAAVDGPETLHGEGPKSEDRPSSMSPSASASPSPSEEGEGPMVPYGHVSKIKLSEGRQAVFSLPDRLTSRDAQKLKGALQGLATIIDSMTDEENDEVRTE
jgi:hypothetical protein